MGLKVPPTADPASNARKGAASGSKMNAVGNEASADVSGAFSSKVGPGDKRASGAGSNMSFDSSCIHEALK